ncbi:MAG: hypothetical protein U5K37_00585 [Natrialbaceae archaeon]|nr:hypothetical protein [Natrialbaceae archaeon]
MIGADDLDSATVTPTGEIAIGDRLIGVVEDFGQSGLFAYLHSSKGISDGDELGTPLWDHGNVSFELVPDDLPPSADHAWNTSGHDVGDPLPVNLNATGLNIEAYDGDLIVELKYHPIFDEEFGLDVIFAANSNPVMVDENDSTSTQTLVTPPPPPPPGNGDENVAIKHARKLTTSI